ncbi:MAG TPA: hypothetical protein VKP61_15080 [Candidatus Acidoferrum sp.]|nr:hypothetical protein [Candidatus Acidoferrum sp.]
MLPGVPATGLPVGTTLVYNAHLDQSFLSWVKTGIGTPDELFQAIGDALSTKWGLTVVGSDYSAVSSFYGGATPITLTVQMAGPETYAQPDDVRSIIDGEIQNALSSNPITDSNVSSFKLPPGTPGAPAGSVDTGAPAADTNPIGSGFSAAASAAGSAIGNAVGSVTSNLGVGSGIVIVVIGLAIIAAVLIGVAPTAPARALAAARRR